MPSSVTHRVFRCIIEVQGVPRAEAALWRSRARRLWHQTLADTFDRHCDRMAPNGERVRIGRLEVEFTASDGDLEPELRERFEHALQARLAQALPSAVPKRTSRAGSDARSDPNDRDWLRVWLLTGALPWWADKPNASSLFDAFRERLRSPDGDGWLRGILRQHPAAIRRLALQWSLDQHARALDGLWSRGWPAAASLLAAASRMAESGASTEGEPAALGEAIWRLWTADRPPPAALVALAERVVQAANPTTLAAFRSALEQVAWAEAGTNERSAEAQSRAFSRADEIREIVERLWSQLPEPSTSARHLASLARASQDLNLLHQWHMKVQEELAATRMRSAAGAKSVSEAHDALTSKTDGHLAIPDEARATASPAASEDSTPSAGSPEGMAPGRAAESPLHTSELHAFDGRPVEVRELFTPGLPVVNAGLVLIAPYLPRFLATVSLVPASAADNSEPNPSRVPLLLHWLATGSAEAVEHELVLPKVLAGIALDEPVVCRHAFPEATLAEANRMLASVIVHWSVLKETSVPGLRESFLQRGGLLREDDAQWLLRVEHRAWDVLLDRVPWTFRTLRLPWMERPVMVEWEAYA